MKSNWELGTLTLLLLACSGDPSKQLEPQNAQGGSVGQAGAGGRDAVGGGGTTGTAGTGGAGIGGTNAAGASGSTSSPQDFKALEQCGPSSCETSEAHGGDGPSSVNEDAALCVLTALRDRKSGFYRHEASAAFGNGSASIEELFLVSADGSVLHVRRSSGQSSSVQRCQLKQPSFFQGCIDAILGTSQKDNAAAWLCLFGTEKGYTPMPSEWTQACAPAEPSCN